MRNEIVDLDALLHQNEPSLVRLERAARFLNMEPQDLERLLHLYFRQGAVSQEEVLICPQDDSIIEQDRESGGYFCDLCEHHFAVGDLASEKVYCITKSATTVTIQRDESKEREKVSQTITDLEWSRIVPWAAKPDREFTVETATLDAGTARRVLNHIEKDGICLIRIEGQSPDEEVVTSLSKFIGPPCEEQNTFVGRIKRVRPQVEGAQNSGDTTADLGLHVDGTQHQFQPAILIFHYVTGAKIGGDSVFVDFAKVILDIPEARRHQILVNLARRDAAEFEKKDMKHTGPIFSFMEGGRVACRVRFDDVIKVHPECQDDFEYLKSLANEDQYRSVFRPSEGDIIAFDNWRILHARDEVLGQRQREHFRMWISTLKKDIQPQYNVGIRPVPIEILMKIKEMNGR